LALSATEEKLRRRIEGDLSFEGSQTGYGPHNTHAFAAKFPPQLPRAFIDSLTDTGEIILDPMVGSGTALVEALLADRAAVGVDLDPLAVKISRAKCTPLDVQAAALFAEQIADRARLWVSHASKSGLENVLAPFDAATKEFLTYWFLPETLLELHGLATGIRLLAPDAVRNFFEVILSSVIITKSGGVSLARDLAHSRPHKVTHKRIRSPIDVFEEKAMRALGSLATLDNCGHRAVVLRGDSRALPLESESVDLIVTSPPYASAIDYVRAHKFSLVWLGYMIPQLTQARRKYIGAEVRLENGSSVWSETARSCLRAVAERDERRSQVIARYFVDMQRSIQEMFRVLRPGRACVIVVGSSTVRGVNILTQYALAEIGEAAGFRLVGVKERKIDRDRRLMPISCNSSRLGIEARMHREHVIALVKP
jgi:DNA modification methylase